MKYVVVLDVEAKDEADDAPRGPEFPRLIDLRLHLTNVLNDVTKHDETIGWRVRSVDSLQNVLQGDVIY